MRRWRPISDNTSQFDADAIWVARAAGWPIADQLLMHALVLRERDGKRRRAEVLIEQVVLNAFRDAGLDAVDIAAPA